MATDPKEKRRAQQRAYYQANKEAVAAKNKAWREANPERYKAATKRYQQANADKVRQTSADWYRQNKQRAATTARVRKLKRYGITPEQYAAIMRHQEHECPICLRLLAHPTRPVVDHSHASGAVRGVLCNRCNTALGLLEESPANLERALEYLGIARMGIFTRWLSGLISTTNSEPSSEP